MDSQEGPPEKQRKLEEVLWKKQPNEFASKVYSDLCLDEKTADAWLECGTENERIPVHKCILAKSSEFFYAMFYGPHAKDGENEYKMDDTKPDAFKAFLKLCYLDAVDLGPNNIIEVVKLTHKFLMSDSLKLCGKIWADNMNIDDICVAYHWAIHFDMDELKEFCERKISASPKLIFETTSFLSCEHMVLERILQLDTLLCDEKFVLQACLNWARNACDRDGLDKNETSSLRKYLNGALYKIRYRSITPKEFREIMHSYHGLFTDSGDYEDIFRLTTECDDLRTDRFISNLRSTQISWKEDCTLEYNTVSIYNLETEKIIGSTGQDIQLQSNRPILLGGIYFSPIFGSYGMTINIEIKDEKKAIHTGQIKHSTSESYLDLTNCPIVIRPTVAYKISLAFRHQFSHTQESYYTTNFSEQIELQGTLVQINKYKSIISKFKFNIL